MAGTITPLPSLDECTSTLSACLGNDATTNNTESSSPETWRKLVQTCLSHGTSYDQLQESQLEKSSLKSRAEEAGNLLSDALEWYLIRWHQQHQKHQQQQFQGTDSNNNNNDDGPTKNASHSEGEAQPQHQSLDIQKRLKDDPVICAVVEALWLVGCLLDNDDETTATATAAASSKPGGEGDAAATKNNLKKVPHECLLAIIRKLTAPRPWMVGGSTTTTTTTGEKGGIRPKVGAKKVEDAMEVEGNDNTNEAAAVEEAPLIPITSLQTALELTLLEAANLLPHPPPVKQPPRKAAAVPDTPVSSIHKKLKKMNTDMYYRQHKFNLMAEESEGYAKLWSFLMLELRNRDDGGRRDGAVGRSNGIVDGEGGNDEMIDDKVYAEAKQHVRELIGAFDLDPNRVLDLTLDALEWELNEFVTKSTKEATVGSKSSFSELSKLAADEDGWWGLERLRTAFASANGGDGENVAIRSLLAIVRELDGNYVEGIYEGRAVAHLLGFKYRSHHNRAAAAAKQAQASGTTGGGNDGKAAAAAANAAAANAANGANNPAAPVTGAEKRGNTYPRSLYLSTAFLCAHDVLDPHALLPHISGFSNSAAASAASKPVAAGKGKDAKSNAAANIATPLMSAYQAHCTDTIKRLKKLGVVSLNSSAKKDDGKTKKEESAAANAEAFRNDPVIGIFRALLALTGDWDSSAAFLAHAATGPAFASLVQQQSNDDDDDEKEVAKLRSMMDTAALAACTICEGVASDVCGHVGSAVGDIYAEIVHNGSNSPMKGNKNGNAHRSSILLPSTSTGTMSFGVLTKESSLSEISSVLKDPLSSLVMSGMICRSQSLYVKICRLYKIRLTPPPSSNTSNDIESPEEMDPSSIDDDTLAVLSTFLVPSLSLFPSDTTLPAELWAVLQNLHYTIRYKLYSSWRHPGLEKATLRALSPAAVRSGAVHKPLGIIESEIDTGIAARYVLKRISKENIADKGRQLAKTSHNNPLVVFTDILGKIESYDNLILMMVDTFEFVTPLGLDVMGYCLLVSLGGGGEAVGQRSRTKMGGLDTEQWLASLETFTGAFYKKFPSVELRGILVYLTRRFAAGQVSELGVLRSLIKTAGGYGFVDYDSTASLSDLQLDGRCGSRLLKRETSSFGVVDDINRRASQRLRSVLQGDDLGVIILILLSQLRSKALYSKPSSNTVKEHVKVIGSTYDDCEAVLCLLLEYLSDTSMDSKAKEKFANSLPSLVHLHQKYGIDAAVAWMLCRPLVRKSMFYMDDGKLLAASKSGSLSPGEPPAYLKPFTTSSPEMTTSYQSLLPSAALENITPTMFETFYSLAIYDMVCPEERYNIDIDRLKKECERLTQLQTGGAAARGQMSVLAAAAAAAGGNYEQVRRATAFTKTHAAELDRLKRNVDQLSKDFQRQKKRCGLVLEKLKGKKESLIVESEKVKEEADGTTPSKNIKNNSKFAPAFTTFCIYPRCLLSPEDSLYCAHFVKLLHKIRVPGFLTIELIDNIVNAVTGSFYCMTEDEAGNCSIFLNELWKCVNAWRYDNDTFASELKDTPGSQLSKAFAEEHDIEIHSLTSGITHDDYKAIYSQWHHKIGSAAIGCLQSSEYMHTRAALIVLSRIVQVFPTQPKAGDRILKTLVPLQGDDNNARPDIRATAQGYSSQLTKARDEGMWKEENITVTKARQEREKMKAEERKKKLAKQHEDLKKESEMISRQLNDNNGRDGRRPRDDRPRQPWADQRMHSRGPPPPPPLSAVAPKFTPKSGDPRELHGRPGGDSSRGRPGMDRGEVWERDRGVGGSGIRPSNDGRGRQVGGAESSSRGVERRKRSRSPEPGEDTEPLRGSTQKRSRGGERGDWAAPHRRGDPSGSSDPQQSSRGGARRSDRRGGGGSSRY